MRPTMRDPELKSPIHHQPWRDPISQRPQRRHVPRRSPIHPCVSIKLSRELQRSANPPRKRQVELLPLIKPIRPTPPYQKLAGVEIEMNLAHVLAREERERVIDRAAPQPSFRARRWDLHCITDRHRRNAFRL